MIFIASLSVYKLLHIITSLLPREVMPWVKVLLGTLLSFLVVGIAGEDLTAGKYVLFSLGVATLSSTVHTCLRLLTYLGDMAARKSIK